MHASVAKLLPASLLAAPALRATPNPALPLTHSCRRDEAGVLYYQFEFTIEKDPPNPFLRHNVSVLAARDDVLLSLNAQCPQARWERDGPQLAAAAATFRLTRKPPARRRRQPY
jgi:hypothetical protein